ncbi:MFS transporter [Bacillus alveayuensis]|uniref:MFS transporter n=1 Tax=Aeribacillus alveayuensis TaxID=279215 RepID=UPI0005CC978D|nr:MFS transporter [Bacillus alveayuensis]
MESFLKSFSIEAKYYLMMNGLFSFGSALSSVFLSIFLWRLDQTFTLLAHYSLYVSLSILLSFYFCAWLARKTSPMTTMRLGILFYLAAYLIALILKDSLVKQIFFLGISQGIAISLFSVGVHMSTLDMATNQNRDRFLYIQGFVTAIGGVVGPLLAGFLIEQFNGMFGYYIVFSITCLFFILAIIVSLPIQGRPIEAKSHLLDVLLHAPREWKWMYVVMLGDGVVSGVYVTFLISMMVYDVAGGELNLGIFQMVSEMVSIVSLLVLAKLSTPEKRVLVYTIGTIGIFLCSLFLAYHPTFIGLILFVLVKPVALNMINTTMNTMIYASIEKDPLYEKMRLDYITIREVPLGVGRMIGVFIFLGMKNYFDLDRLLPVSFSLFPVIYLMMVPVLYMIWHKKDSRKKYIGKLYN